MPTFYLLLKKTNQKCDVFVGSGSIQPRKRVLDHADYAAYTLHRRRFFFFLPDFLMSLDFLENLDHLRAVLVEGHFVVKFHIFQMFFHAIFLISIFSKYFFQILECEVSVPNMLPSVKEPRRAFLFCVFVDFSSKKNYFFYFFSAEPILFLVYIF